MSEICIQEPGQIAKEAYIYANPLVDNYRIMYGAFIDKKDPEYKAPFHQLKNYAWICPHEDRPVELPSAFLDQLASKAVAVIDFIKPLTREDITKSPKIFEQPNFVLQLCITYLTEQALMARFAKLNIGAGKTFSWDGFSPEIQATISWGIAAAWAEFEALKKRADAGDVPSGDVFGMLGASCGYAAFDSVNPEVYEAPFCFTGEIKQVIIDVSGEVIKDDEAELKRLMTQQ